MTLAQPCGDTAQQCAIARVEHGKLLQCSSCCRLYANRRFIARVSHLKWLHVCMKRCLQLAVLVMDARFCVPSPRRVANSAEWRKGRRYLEESAVVEWRNAVAESGAALEVGSCSYCGEGSLHSGVLSYSRPHLSEVTSCSFCSKFVCRECAPA